MDKRAFHKLSYGLYVIGTAASSRINAQTANALIQVTSDPPRVAFALNKANFTHELMRESVFSCSVLSQDAPLELIGGFGFSSGRDHDKF